MQNIRPYTVSENLQWNSHVNVVINLQESATTIFKNPHRTSPKLKRAWSIIFPNVPYQDSLQLSSLCSLSVPDVKNCAINYLVQLSLTMITNFIITYCICI